MPTKQEQEKSLIREIRKAKVKALAALTLDEVINWKRIKARLEDDLYDLKLNWFEHN